MSEICEGYPNRDVDSKGIRPEVRKLINDLQAGKVDLSLKNYEPDILDIKVSEESQNEISMIDLQPGTEDKKRGFLDRIRKTAIVATAAAGLASFTNIVDIKPVQAAENPTAIVEVQQQNTETEKVLVGLVDPENFFNDKNKREIAMMEGSLFGFKPEYRTDAKKFFRECGYVGTPVEFGSHVLVSPQIVESAAKKLNESGLQKTASNFMEAIFRGSKVLDASNCKSSMMMIFVTEKDRQKYYYTMSGTNPLFTKLIPGGKPENISPSDDGKFKYDLVSERMVLIRKIDGSVKYYNEGVATLEQFFDIEKDNGSAKMVPVEEGSKTMVIVGDKDNNKNALSPEFVENVVIPVFKRAEELLDTSFAFGEKPMIILRCSDPIPLASYQTELLNNSIFLGEEMSYKAANSWGIEHTKAFVLGSLIVERYGLQFRTTHDLNSKYEGMAKTFMLRNFTEKLQKAGKLTKVEYKVLKIEYENGIRYYFQKECNNSIKSFQENAEQFFKDKYDITDVEAELKNLKLI